MKKFNNRVVTYLYSYKNEFPDNKELSEMPDERLFKIVSVYYNKTLAVKPIKFSILAE